MRKIARIIRLLPVMIVAVILFNSGGASVVSSQTNGGSPAEKLVLVADVTGVIGPAAMRFVEQAIEVAQERQAELLVLRMNTPGGLVTSMREIIEGIIASPVPVAIYVAPPGARAASAGTYILYAAHIAAMAPGTNLGAATPIEVGGLPNLPSPDSKDGDDGSEQKEGDETQESAPADPGKAKAVNDAVAFIRSLAELSGRNAEWAERAVRQAATLSAQGALRNNVIEFIASDLEDLVEAVDGRTVTIGRIERTLSTSGARIEQLEPGVVNEILALITNPNVALILMMIGIYGLIFEFANPGTIGPGIIGIICLILGLYALNQLPLDYAGLALVILGVIFMTIEALTPAFGVFGIGGLAAFVIGASMLVDTDVPAYQLSWSVIAAVAITSGLILILLLGYMWRTFQRPVQTGEDQIRGQEAEVLDWSGREGHVWLAGERWNARSNQTFGKGDKVRVTRLDGLTLLVEGSMAGDHAVS